MALISDYSVILIKPTLLILLRTEEVPRGTRTFPFAVEVDQV